MKFLRGNVPPVNPSVDVPGVAINGRRIVVACIEEIKARVLETMVQAPTAAKDTYNA